MTARFSANGKRLGRPPKDQPEAASPGMLQRLAARFFARYDAAGQGRRMAGWNPPAKGPNSALVGVETLRKRARDSVRNDWASESAKQKWSTALVGIGITPRFRRITDTARRAEITDLFQRFAAECDADGVLDFFGLQTLVTGAEFEGGEVFARLRPRFIDEGLAVPMQVQILESEMLPFLDVDAGGRPGLPEGNVIRSGIELNKRGKRIAYWFHKEHPLDGKLIGAYDQADDFVRVAASQVAHIYVPRRPGQLRGVSRLAPVLAKLRDIGDYEDTVLQRQKIANLFVAFIKRSIPSLDPLDPVYGALTGAAADFAAGGTPMTDDAGAAAPLLPMSPGLMQELEDGQEVQFANPPEAGTNFSDYLRTQNMGTAAALGLPYELHAGDIREISDRTLRVVMQEARRYWAQNQWQMLIPMFCKRVAGWFADNALLAGEITVEEAELIKLAEFSPHGWEYIHPVQDPQGKKIEVDAGFRSRSSVIAERGDDPDQVDEERQADKERQDRLGLTPVAAPAPDGQQQDPQQDQQAA